MFNFRISAATFAVLAAAGAASAQQAILSFGFTELDGGYATAGSTFSATGIDQGAGNPLRSTGDVTDLQRNLTASYAPGAAAGLVNISLNVFNIVGTTSAQGVGTLAITDANGDQLVANVSGSFIGNGNSIFFNGGLTNVALVNNHNDGLFDGPSGGSFPLTFAPAPPPYTGYLIQLTVGSPSNFFQSSWTGVSTQASGEVIPAPGALAALGMMGLALSGRRRRR